MEAYVLALSLLWGIHGYDNTVVEVGWLDSVQAQQTFNVKGLPGGTFSMTTDFETRAATQVPTTYNFRLRDGKNEVEITHSKSYASSPAPFGHLELSDGYNFIFANKVHGSKWKFRHGVGIVLGHPDSSYNGQRYFNEGVSGFIIGGLAGQVAVQRDFKLTKRMNFYTEVKAIAAVGPEFKFGPASAQINHQAVQWHFGLSYRF